MKIIILGAGQVGSTVARHLAKEEVNDITVVDLREHLLRDLQDRLDINTVCGFASHPHILRQAGVTVLDEQAVEIQGVGFAGVKGFVGGFGRGELAAFGEAAIKAFVDEAHNEARKLENGLRSLRTDRAVAVLHYAPIVGTVMGEPEAIFPFLGSSRLADAIDRFGNVRAVVHGHAHRGTYEGRTLRDIPVYNCAQFVVRREFDRPYALIEV